MVIIEDRSTVLHTKARHLVNDVLARFGGDHASSLMSCAVYDTAWLAMIRKPHPNNTSQSSWLFPESFTYILDAQLLDGGWESYGSHSDGILNTAASILAMQLHHDEPAQLHGITAIELSERLDRACKVLQRLLSSWDVKSCVHVGFEILVPKLLRMLEKNGRKFEFNGFRSLMALNKQKLSRFRPEMVYGELRTTPLYSLEAFDGIESEKVKHHKSLGALMASTSSTASYLMGLKTWDDEAEAYLKRVVSIGPGRGSGGVPGAFPTTYFEMTWVVTTLLEAFFTPEQLGRENLAQIAQVLSKALEEEGGILGFSPKVGADADDTAKTILTLSMLGQPVDASALLQRFETEDRFLTYQFERTPSFSANCNVLSALLHLQSLDQYTTSIGKAARFICNWWHDSDRPIPDKWNTTFGYNAMLMVQGLVQLLDRWNQGNLQLLDDDLIFELIPLAIFQALLRCLAKQKPDGMWGNSAEETAYSVIILATAGKLPSAEPLLTKIDESIKSAQKALLHSGLHRQASYIWVGKTSYKSEILSETYILAALNSSTPNPMTGDGIASLSTITAKKIALWVKFYSGLPGIAETPRWMLLASVIEGSLQSRRLLRKCKEAFPEYSTDVPERTQQYLEYIPVVWTICSNKNGIFCSSKILFDMMIMSFLTYKVDEFMETVATIGSSGLQDLKQTISKAISCIELTEATQNNSLSPTDNVHNTLVHFVTYVMGLPTVINATGYDKGQLQQKLHIFLDSHVDQLIQDELFFSENGGGIGRNNRSIANLHHWVHGAASSSTSCAHVFNLLLCSYSGDGDVFETAEQEYLAESLSNHLAAMCRIDNDLGSMARDKEDGTLNAAEFPKVTTGLGAKTQLLNLACWERKQVAAALGALLEVLVSARQQRVGELLRMFSDVCDVYGQIYHRHDLCSINPSSQ
ncbi:aphidicolan-16beta-ol synthase [Periconia macrospinosa]|uniref:Aphidicolan-16beta-ol synthase n=1 Tax=Periconia macrospinosa TaxID=97972 RepID=A0A2V1DFJ6_9PLEO|nr:aphidicolan-16beta-ol synthase [Periconia macrospinosa]